MSTGRSYLLLTILLLCASQSAVAQVLPEDRFDAMYHYYDGDEVEVSGPSLLIRKKLTDDFSAYANYYMDDITSASVDVRSYASEYDEERTEITIGGDMLVGETIVSAGFTDSDEDDYDAQTAFFGLSQEVFSGMTTVRLGYSRGWDDVKSNVDSDFKEDVDRYAWRVGVSQIMTKDLVMTFDYEGRSDEGYLNNPYRQVRYEAPTAPQGFLWQPEVYPNTRDSSAFAVGGRYFLDGWKTSAIYSNFRYYTDSWEIDAYNVLGGYTVEIAEDWLLDLSYRYYTQSEAEFFSDLFPFVDAQNFLGRDKQISDFDSHTARLGVTYDFLEAGWRGLQRGTVNLDLSYIYYDYSDYRDVPKGGPAGDEPLFDFDAIVGQFYISIWF